MNDLEISCFAYLSSPEFVVSLAPLKMNVKLVCLARESLKNRRTEESPQPFGLVFSNRFLDKK